MTSNQERFFPNTASGPRSRPRSAYDSNQYASKSLGKIFQLQSNLLDERTVNSIWKAFGSYSARQLRNGKAIHVPRFGLFTFSAAHVDLAGTTNPDQRDKQHRHPVFLVGKDFVSGVTLKSGQAHGQSAQIRPYDIKGVSGAIPKCKINYTDIGTQCGSNKDICKNACEQVFRFLSDKVRKGETCTMDIPFVGTFMVRTGIAAVAFSNELIADTQGATGRTHFVNKLFASSVQMHNMQMKDQIVASSNPLHMAGGSIRVSHGAEKWLENNLHISLKDLNRATIPRVQSAKPIQGKHRFNSMRPAQDNQAWNYQTQGQEGITEQKKRLFDKMSASQSQNVLGIQDHRRPMSAAPRSVHSFMTNVPEVSRMKLMVLAGDIYKGRSALSDILKNGKYSLRSTLSSTQVFNFLKRIGINTELTTIKALLREYGYNWNGPTCSMYELFVSSKEYVYGQTRQEEKTGQIFQPSPDPRMKLEHQHEIAKGSRTALELIQMLKDLFYSAQKTAYQIFNEGRTGNNIDVEGFLAVVKKYSAGKISEKEIRFAFLYASEGAESMTYEKFEKHYKWELPGGSRWETLTIRRIREWMFKNSYSSDTLFEFLCKRSGRHIEKTLTRVDFHKAMGQTGIGLGAPDIDALFTLLDLNQDRVVDLIEWKSRIYEDAVNPLQLLRDIIQQSGLTPDDLLFKMKLRIWDAPLDFHQFTQAMRFLDPTLSDPQLRHLAKVLKSKDNKVDVTSLLRNLAGEEFETVDYRNKIFRQLYIDIHPHKEQKLIQLLEDCDPLNDGRVEPQGLKMSLKKIGVSLKDEDIDRFVRFLDKDQSGKVNYMEFVHRMAEVSNRNHNPFKSVIERLSYFMEQNKQTPETLIGRLIQKQDGHHEKGLELNIFAQFLKSKIDKKRDELELRKFAHFMDIDKDGYVSPIDLETCLKNINSIAFFKNGGEALAQSAFNAGNKFYPSQAKLSDERAAEICKQIRTALVNKKMAFREVFSRFDENKDGFLSYSEFSHGFDTILTLSAPIKEKLFALMDKNQIGLVDYPNFLEIIQVSTANKPRKATYQDNFDWEQGKIEELKKWIERDQITVEEAFKCLDRDFDGVISKEDLSWALVNILKVKPEEIETTKLDRLFRLMDFYKTNGIQLSDIQRIVHNENPYSAGQGNRTMSASNFNRSLGGSFAKTSTFDWKMSAIQQMGLVMSKKYSNVKESFEVASERMHKVKFDMFKNFIEENRALAGFNMTIPLIQKLFAELDPHKKGYLTEQDWLNAFSSFNWNEQLLVELKNAVQVAFADCDSAFEFFRTFKVERQQPKLSSVLPTLSQQDFEKAVNSLTGNRFKVEELKQIWNQLTEGGKLTSLTKYAFRSHFDMLTYQGRAVVRTLRSAPVTGAQMGTTIKTESSSSSQWSTNIFEKLRQIIRTSPKSFEDIFKEFDEDGNGTISVVEFRNALRKLNLGISSREIDQIMARIDSNSDGKIDWFEFIAKFKTKDLDETLKLRARDKLARLKEMMVLHMTSPADAFRFFDSSKMGKLTYKDFSSLFAKLAQLASERVPNYAITKDLFDTIDIRKDGIIDLTEWQQTFGNVSEGDNKLTIRATPLNQWESSREYKAIGTLICRNRKLLKERFEQVAQGQATINFDQVKSSLSELMNHQFPGLADDKLKTVLRVAEIQEANASSGFGNLYDHAKLLEIYRKRHGGA